MKTCDQNLNAVSCSTANWSQYQFGLAYGNGGVSTYMGFGDPNGISMNAGGNGKGGYGGGLSGFGMPSYTQAPSGMSIQMPFWLSHPGVYKSEFNPFADEVDWMYVTADGSGVGGPAGDPEAKKAASINSGVGIGTGLFGASYWTDSKLLFRYGRVVNGKVRSASVLTRANKISSLKLANSLSRTNIITGTLGVAYSGHRAISDYQQGGIENVNGWDVADAVVGTASVATSGLVFFGLVSNPVGWGVAIGTGLYFGGRLIHDYYSDEQ